jgi:hypothetical protein
MDNKPKTTSDFVAMVQRIALPLATAVALILALLGFLEMDMVEGNDPTARGVTNFDSITLAEDLSVGDDATITGDLIVGSGSLYPLLIDDSSEAIYAGSSTITGTEAITTASHGLSSITAAGCSLGESPGTGAGDAALCWVGVSGSTVTVTVEQDDWTTDATAGASIYYWIIGTP